MRDSTFIVAPEQNTSSLDPWRPDSSLLPQFPPNLQDKPQRWEGRIKPEYRKISWSYFNEINPNKSEIFVWHVMQDKRGCKIKNIKKNVTNRICLWYPLNINIGIMYSILILIMGKRIKLIYFFVFYLESIIMIPTLSINCHK